MNAYNPTTDDTPPSVWSTLTDLRIPHNEVSFATDFLELDTSRPVSLVTANMGAMDPTEAIPDGDCFVVRQVDENGQTHTLVLSEKMTIELMGLMNAWISIG